jgi:hypothetical protein
LGFVRALALRRAVVRALGLFFAVAGFRLVVVVAILLASCAIASKRT